MCTHSFTDTHMKETEASPPLTGWLGVDLPQWEALLQPLWCSHWSFTINPATAACLTTFLILRVRFSCSPGPRCFAPAISRQSRGVLCSRRCSTRLHSPLGVLRRPCCRWIVPAHLLLVQAVTGSGFPCRRKGTSSAGSLYLHATADFSS